MQDASKLPDERALHAILQDVLVETNVPGIGMAISVRGKIVALAAGVSTLNTEVALTTASRFEMSCLMKFFVSLVTLELAKGGTLDLGAPIATFLPELKGDLGGKSANITLRHLLSHTSGYRGFDITDMKVRWNYSWDQFVQHFTTLPPSFTPGMIFNYEHSEHVVLGEILHRATGKTARTLVQERILKPLNIETGTAQSDKNDPEYFIANHAFSPATGKFAPVAIPPFGMFWDASLPDRSIALIDVVRVAGALLQGETFSPSTLANLIPPTIVLPQGIHSDHRSEHIPCSFGIGCAQYGYGVLGHNGSMLGQTCGLRFDPQTDMAVIVGVNARSTYARDTALRRIWAAATNIPEDTSRHAASQTFSLDDMLSGFTLDQVSGHYVGSYLGEIAVVRDADKLRFDVGPVGNRRSSFHIAPVAGHGDQVYALESRSPVSVAFVRNADMKEPALFLGVHGYKKIS